MHNQGFFFVVNFSHVGEFSIKIEKKEHEIVLSLKLLITIFQKT
jgi:hypothetical protein